MAIPVSKQLEFNFCLLPETTDRTPKDDSRLLRAGLGKRTISINDNADHTEVLHFYLFLAKTYMSKIPWCSAHFLAPDKVLQPYHNVWKDTCLVTYTM